jgi:hypothetical protein
MAKIANKLAQRLRHHVHPPGCCSDIRHPVTGVDDVRLVDRTPVRRTTQAAQKILKKTKGGGGESTDIDNE